MIKITNHADCCGCTACSSICPKQCIIMREDKEGFLYPIVNMENCIDCGKCEAVCHIRHQGKQTIPLKTYAAYSQDEHLRKTSSSGGVFSMLAEQVIAKGGVVFGARFNEQWSVIIDYTEIIEGLAAFRGSKYVQAAVGNAYSKCEIFLKEGRCVLFSGTPCQIAGLGRYLRKEYDNLLTVDFSCHGVPSPLVWRRYLSESLSLMKKEVKNILFREKREGWETFNFTIQLDNQRKVLEWTWPCRENPYMKAFLNNLILRPSCANCKAKEGRSGSDITLADYWCVDKVHPQLIDDKGVNLVVVRTEKGLKSIKGMRKAILIESRYEEGMRYNEGLWSSAWIHSSRWRFFKKLSNEDSVIRLIDRCLHPTFLEKIENRIVRTLQQRGICYALFESNHSLIQDVFSIDFRDKRFGWNQYNMVIRIKIKK